MDQLDEKKTLMTSRSLRYTYHLVPALNGQPTVLLLHGFPDSATLWFDFIRSHLQPAGYGAIAIDCLGYGGSSKPSDTVAYNFKDMTADVCEILDAANLGKVIVLGHDWGSNFAQRVYNYHPERTLALAMVNVAYMPPGMPLNLDQINDMTSKTYGYGILQYWNLFASEEGADTLSKHAESMWTALHGRPEAWREVWCQPDSMKNYLLRDEMQPTEHYATQELKEAWISRLQRDGFDGPLRWYKSLVRGVQGEVEKDSAAMQNMVINVPTLFVAASRDVVCRPDAIDRPLEMGLLPKLTTVTVDAGHWCMLAMPEEFGEKVTTWMRDMSSGTKRE